jgi:hypothetical protein
LASEYRLRRNRAAPPFRMTLTLGPGRNVHCENQGAPYQVRQLVLVESSRLESNSGAVHGEFIN